jgi:phenylacetate-coenzyme A ligase PaaK-like adenylate-forming protein
MLDVEVLLHVARRHHRFALRAVRVLLALRAGAPAESPLLGAALMADRPTHVSRSAPQTFAGVGALLWRHVSALAPWRARLADLNQLEPQLLATYPSVLAQLALAQKAGDLRIAPRVIFCTSEPLLASTRESAEQAWHCPVINCWASSQAGGMAVGCGHGPGMHLSDDALIIEAVDRDGRPVPYGVRSSKVFVTNLYNALMPLIRFEITDEITLSGSPCACGSAHRLVADVEGRLDDGFEYTGVGTLHPSLFRGRLAGERNMVE